jgi:uncharacterized protein DUF6631
MAKRAQASKSAAEPPSAAEQLQVLSPDVTVTIAGRQITVREYEYFEGLEIAHKTSAFIAAMHDACRDGELRYDAIRRLFGVHRDAVIPAAAQSAGVEAEWIHNLEREDKEAFMSTWFGVNSGFFVREVVVEMREERQRAVLRSIGSISSSASARPDSAISSNSVAAQSGS